MRVLWLTYDLPYPLNSGGKIRAYHLIKGLSADHEIDLFSFIRSEDQLQYTPELKKFCHNVETFRRPEVWSVGNILRCGFSAMPFSASSYYFSEVRQVLQKSVVENKYDLVHFESYYPAVYLPFIKSLKAKTFFAEENIEYQIYERFTRQKIKSLAYPVLLIDVAKMKRYEQNLWREADYVAALSDPDANTIRESLGREVPIVPNGVDTELYSQVSAGQNERPTIMFVGNLKYQGNGESIKYFLSEIMPNIFKEVSDARFLIVSADRPSWFEALAKDLPVELIQDKNSSMVNFFSQSHVFVAPITVASGTNIKVLEAMAAGLPVVTTSLGAEGFNVTSGENIIVADDPVSFAQNVIALLKSSSGRAKIGHAARILVQGNYDWKYSVQKMAEVYTAIAARR